MHVKGIFCGQGKGDILTSDFIIDMRISNLVNPYFMVKTYDLVC